jgi:uncharacterized protein DUF6998
MLDVNNTKNAIKNYVQAKKKLRELDIAISERQIVSEIGEWLVIQIYNGKRAENKTQKHWDILIEDKKIQVKAHAKGDNTTARWTNINYPKKANIDELIVIIFSQDFTLKEFYRAPWKSAYKLIKRENKKPVINWNDLATHRIDIHDLPKQNIVKIFS